MAGDPRIRQLLERMLETGEPPELVCRDAPELLAEVLAGWRRIRPLQDELEALFPTPGAAAAAATDTLPADDVAVPGYRIDGVLGRGGMGIVYRAHHLRLQRTVALKMMLGGSHASPTQLARFRREAEVVASLRHPNIVQVHDVGEVDGIAWFTMEHVPGGTLAARMREPVRAREAATLVATLATATQCAHENGVVHRDLKPSNVLLAADGTPKISDFGLARCAAHTTALTLGGALGTPDYMAPEQIRGDDREVGPAADVHALGAILYELLAGQPPFHGATVATTLHQVLEKDPVPPSRLSSRVPRDLETIALKCLAKQPAKRYARAADLADDLQRFLRHEPVHARRVGLLGRGLRWGRRRPAAATLVALLVLGLVWVVGDAVHARNVAAWQREQNANWSAVLDRVHDALEGNDLAAAATLLDRLPAGLPAELRDRVAAARAEVQLVRTLEDIRMERSAIVEGSFDFEGNRTRADHAYEQVFATAGFRLPATPNDAWAERLARSPVRSTLVAAIDDWALCTEDRARRTALLAITRRSDPDPGGWRDRVRNPDLGDDGQALQELADTAPMTESSVQLLSALGERLQRSGMDARPFLLRVQQAFPGDFWANYHLGDRLRASEPAEAVRYFQAAVAIRPQSLMARLGLGYSLLYSGRAGEALAVYERAIGLGRNVADAHAQLAMCLHQTGDREASVAAYRESLRLNPVVSHVHQNLGNVFVELGRHDEALVEYREAVRLEPDNPAANYSLAICLRTMRRFDESVVAAQRLVDLDADAGTHYVLAMSQACAGQTAKAEAEFRRSLALQPTFVRSLHGLRTLLAGQGRSEEARQLWERSLALDRTDHEAHDGFAELCLYLGREDDHARACAELLRRFSASANPHVLERTGRACLLSPTLPVDLHQQAAALVDRAAAADSAHAAAWAPPYFQLSAAIGDYRLGRFASALERLAGDASRVLPPVPALVLSMCQHRLGAQDAAAAAFAEAVLRFDWSPDGATDRETWINHVLRREAAALLVPELAALLAGSRAPANALERLALLAESSATGRFALAADLYSRVFADDPRLADGAGRPRLHAARVAARAAGSGTEDAGQFRDLARAGLGSELRAAAQTLAVLPDRRDELAEELAAWTRDEAFAPIRTAEALAQMAADERAQCESLWRDVAALVATIAAMRRP